MKCIYRVRIYEKFLYGLGEENTILKGELFYSDYQKLFNYLRLNLYERKDGKELIDVCNSELWEKDYNYQVRVNKRIVEG